MVNFHCVAGTTNVICAIGKWTEAVPCACRADCGKSFTLKDCQIPLEEIVVFVQKYKKRGRFYFIIFNL
jgi:hypothetical protein